MSGKGLPLFESDETAPPQRGQRGRLPSYALRVSLLEQCQFQCPYCMPGAVQPTTERASWLRASDYARLAPLLAEAGVRKVRFTGGEPLLREDTPDIIAAFRAALPEAELALTTNGQKLPAQLDRLVDAGLSRVTVHLDTLRDDRYPRLMGKGTPAEILAACEATAERVPLKLNAVVQRGQNDDELLDLLALGQRLGAEVRFIELMNTGSAANYVDEVFVTGREIVELVASEVPVRRRDRRHPSDPAALFDADLPGGSVTFGLIASDTEPFCDACDRLRLTADGRLRGCLYEAGGVPLGAALRAGADDGQLAALIGVGLDDKRSYHPLIAPKRVPFSMAEIGG